MFFGIGIYCHQRKKKLGKGAKYGLDCSPQQSEMAVEYIAQDPSVVGSSPSCELTVPMMRQESRNLTKVSEVDMSVGENWEIGRELINLQEVLGEGAFGRVMKAEVFGIPNMPFRCHVAVKMIKGEFCIWVLYTKPSFAIAIIKFCIFCRSRKKSRREREQEKEKNKKVKKVKRKRRKGKILRPKPRTRSK